MADSMASRETKFERYKKRVTAMKTDRSSWEPHWREIQQFISPRSGRWSLSEQNQGGKKGFRIINGAATIASKTCSAGMMSGNTSQSRPWFRITTPDPAMMEIAAVKQWLFQVEVRIRDVLARSNIYSVLPNIYRELADYGTAALWAEPDDEQIIRFYPLTVGTYWIATDHRRDVDTLYREIRMTVRQVVDKWGEDKLSPDLKSKYLAGNRDATVDIAHMVCPNTEREYGKADSKNKPWSSCYWECGKGAEGFLSESGFDTKPFMAPRWDVLGEDIYGSSCGMDAIGDAKTLQVREKQFAMAVDKHVDPQLQGPAELKNASISTLPGSVTFVNNLATGGAGLRPVYEVKPDYQGALIDKKDIIKRIRDAYYADLFLMISQPDAPNRTAYEVSQIREEKLMALGPVVERLNTELLDPLIDRTFGVMLDRGLIPEPPEELQGVALKIDYISILAQAQKVLMTGSIERYVQFIAVLAKFNPAALDKLDTDQAADEYGADLGVPPAIVVSDDRVAELRQARQQQQQMQQAAAMAPAVKQYADAAKAAGSATVDPASVLGGLAEQAGPGALALANAGR
ncbi:portal protein [Luteibacter sp. NPDC031894]|uniref:portal protein n=1 Tax=Luteibacter sp. NPDC031894 TaxID=3390572 RepID=UPI003D03E887